jgi:hypothetical protein
MSSLLRISALILAFSSNAALAESLSFDRLGGDAWQFQLSVSGHARSSRCDHIDIRSASGHTRALQIHDRFFASVSLVPGQNSLQAMCLLNGETVSSSEAQ